MRAIKSRFTTADIENLKAIGQLGFALALLAANPLAEAVNLPAGTLCQADEQVFFSCPVKAKAKNGAKIVSLCGSPSLDKTSGYLQYRYGRPKAVELEFPGKRDNTQALFGYAHYTRPQTSRTAVNFANAGTQYSIFDSDEGDGKTAVREKGVQVKLSTGKTITLACDGKAISDLTRLENVLPCDKDDPLNLGGCQ